jgi:ketosteroid isomerase-like protein
LNNESSNRERLEALFKAASAGEGERAFGMLVDMCAPDIVVHEPPFVPWGGDYEGRAEFLQLFALIAQHIDPTKMVVLHMVGDDESVVVLMRGEFRSNRDADPVPVLLSEWYTFRNGQVVEIRPFYWSVPSLVSDELMN